MGKYAAYTITTLKNTQVYKFDLLLRIMNSFILVIAFREIWKAIYANGQGLALSTGVTSQGMQTYAMLSVILFAIMPPSISYEISDKVRDGSIVFDMQKPWDFEWMHFSKAAGVFVFNVVYAVIPQLIAVLLFFPIDYPAGMQAAAFAVSVLLAFLLSFLINFIVGMLAILFTETWGIDMFKSVIIDICSGAMIPLWFFPDAVSRVLLWLPFQGIFNIPLSLFIGKITGAAVWEQLAFQAVWCLLLLLLSRMILAWIERKLVISGG
ncbi:ABC-2 type transport system permease protein [Paenibacillus forsythiae]|uniref:ABC-2 type transport system permease protein n=1 Tax=Paenibacillus forsythiae TaxID=365616 RepID=A0ABU3H8A9_9BACL|nr:ABC-2 family transporter protein [Paenibacillus forsythiae]MDT3427053.1 ABC-2 type transport system permease protein [Paenibacillus forsythiae]